MESLLDVDLLLPHQSGHFIDQRAVFQDQQMSVENACVFRAHGLANLPLNVENLLTGQD